MNDKQASIIETLWSRIREIDNEALEIKIKTGVLDLLALFDAEEGMQDDGELILADDPEEDFDDD